MIIKFESEEILVHEDFYLILLINDPKHEIPKQLSSLVQIINHDFHIKNEFSSYVKDMFFTELEPEKKADLIE